ncbi:MAG: hypothetical protein KUG79_02780 [Pseudomonadales bacterium]|nr:hypothetical protein [Pseudomonadales bacterium]
MANNRPNKNILIFILSLIIGLQISLMLILPGWEKPQGMLAGFVWGGILTFTLTSVASSVALAFIASLLFGSAKRALILIEATLIAVLFLATVILCFIYVQPAKDPRTLEAEKVATELRLKQQYEHNIR